MDDILKLNLMESYGLPILTYATSAMKLSNEQERDLNAGWNSVYRRIFGFNKWESVRDFIGGIGRLNFSFMRSYLQIKFCKFGLINENQTYKSVMRMHYLSHIFKNLCSNAGLSSFDYFQIRNRSTNFIHDVIYKAFKAS